MSTSSRLSEVYKKAKIIPYDSTSKFVLMSDCHRGDGTWSDNFSKNQNLFFAAMNYYYSNNFTYIELGDGDELWENRNLDQVISMHSDAFWLMSRFYKENRFHMIYGNHDMMKKNNKYTATKCTSYYYECEKMNMTLFPNIKIQEGIVLKDIHSDTKILLVHGHQGDLLNDTLWPITKFMVRYIWHPLELVGVLDPTSAAKNYTKKSKIEKKLIKWVEKEDKLLVAGHTHRPVFPKPGEPPYFNDGSCVHPRCITAIEIENNCIILVKWTTQTRDDRTLFVNREVLEGPTALSLFAPKN